MLVKLRLARWGKRHNPFFGLVAATVRSPRDGRHLERLGTYCPIPEPVITNPLRPNAPPPASSNASTQSARPPVMKKHLTLNTARIKFWLGSGAQPTRRVAWLLAKAGLMPPTPEALHKSRQLDVNDPDTWPLRLLDESGKELAVVNQASLQRLNAQEQNTLKEMLPEKPILPHQARPPNRAARRWAEFIARKKKSASNEAPVEGNAL